MPALMVRYQIELVLSTEMFDRDGDFVDVGEEAIHSR